MSAPTREQEAYYAVLEAWTNRSYTLQDYSEETKGMVSSVKGYCRLLAKCVAEISGEDTYIVMKRGDHGAITETLSSKALITLLNHYPVRVRVPNPRNPLQDLVKSMSTAKMLEQAEWRDYIKEYRGMRFVARSSDELSVWQGWPVEPQEDPEAIKLFLQFVNDVICAGKASET
jgi:hypothetical protein